MDTARQFTSFVQFISDVLGSTKDVKIDTCIYRHSGQSHPTLNSSDDIYTFKCSKTCPLTMTDIKAFLKYFTDQTYEIEVHRSYYYFRQKSKNVQNFMGFVTVDFTMVKLMCFHSLSCENNKNSKNESL